MTYLCNIYGYHVLSGQQEIYGGNSPDAYAGYNGDGTGLLLDDLIPHRKYFIGL